MGGLLIENAEMKRPLQIRTSQYSLQSLAQLIRDDWGDCNDVPRDTLICELEWLQTSVSDTSDPAEQSTADDKLEVEILKVPETVASTGWCN